jgi:DNA-binding PadR family transcriptional regulator
LEQGLKNDEICHFISPKSDGINLKRAYERYPNFYQFFVVRKPRRGGSIHYDVEPIFEDILSNLEFNSHVRCLVDFGKRFDPNDIERIVEFEELMKRKHKLTVMNAFNFDFLDQETLSGIWGMHDKVIVSTKNLTSFSFPILPSEKKPEVQIISKEAMDQCVKKFFDIVILAMLLKKPLCGFDVIKEIVQNFGVLLSQGTVYPYLYSLERKDYLESEIKSDNKTKIYSLTEKGKAFAEKKVKEHALAQKRIIENILGDIFEK